jgi:hypothetical protein
MFPWCAALKFFRKEPVMTRFFQLSLAAAALALGAALSPAFAGRMPDPGADHQFLGANQSMTYPNEWFRGGDLAAITINGDGSSDLDVYVYDQYGHLIVSDTAAGDHCFVTFTPRWTGPFTIRVVNAGNVGDIYDLETN